MQKACLLDKGQDVGGPVKARLHGVAQKALLKVAQVCRLPPGLCKLQRTASLLCLGSQVCVAKRMADAVHAS